MNIEWTKPVEFISECQFGIRGKLKVRVEDAGACTPICMGGLCGFFRTKICSGINIKDGIAEIQYLSEKPIPDLVKARETPCANWVIVPDKS